jgi:hypothetical protein
MKDKKSADGVGKGAGISHTFNAVGRAAEAGYVSYSQVRMNFFDQIPWIFWNEPKVSKMHLIPFYPDYCSWALDFCFFQFCYIVCGGGLIHSRVYT